MENRDDIDVMYGVDCSDGNDDIIMMMVDECERRWRKKKSANKDRD